MLDATGLGTHWHLTLPTVPQSSLDKPEVWKRGQTRVWRLGDLEIARTLSGCSCNVKNSDPEGCYPHEFSVRKSRLASPRSDEIC